jgi:hypothetical protein
MFPPLVKAPVLNLLGYLTELKPSLEASVSVTPSSGMILVDHLKQCQFADTKAVSGITNDVACSHDGSLGVRQTFGTFPVEVVEQATCGYR